MVLLETCTWSNLILNECGEHKLVLASLTSKSKLDVLRRPTRKGGKMVVWELARIKQKLHSEQCVRTPNRRAVFGRELQLGWHEKKTRERQKRDETEEVGESQSPINVFVGWMIEGADKTHSFSHLHHHCRHSFISNIAFLLVAFCNFYNWHYDFCNSYLGREKETNNVKFSLISLRTATSSWPSFHKHMLWMLIANTLAQRIAFVTVLEIFKKAFLKDPFTRN